MGDIKGDTRSLDYSSHVCSQPAMARYLGCEPKHVAGDGEGSFLYNPCVSPLYHISNHISTEMTQKY